MSSYDEFPTIDSFPDSYRLKDDLASVLNADDGLPRICLMGLRRSGKTSIQKVVFHKVSPHETLFLQSTTDIRVKDITNNPLVHFQILDFPGNYDFSDPHCKHDANKIFKRCGALVFVIDAQDDRHPEAIAYFLKLVKIAYKVNPHIHFEVLVHKVDGDSYMSDDHKIDCQQDINQQITEELEDSKLNVHPSFHLTSIYDHSIFEAFSKTVQKLIPQFAFLENLLDILLASCNIEKAFLFDVVSKIYVATDSSPVDMQTYELCSDMIDVVTDVSCIYGIKDKDAETLAFDSESASVIKLSNKYVLYLREVNKCLALVCLMKNESFKKSGLVEYNFMCFKQAITKLLESKKKFAKKSQASSANNLAVNSSSNSNSNGNSNSKKTIP